MNIVHCLFTMRMGGAQVLAIGLMNEMCESNNVTLVIVNNEWSDELLAGLDSRVKVQYIRRKPGSRSPLPIMLLNMLLYKLKPEVIHCHESNMAPLIKLRKPVVLQTIHDVNISTKHYSLYHKSLAISYTVAKDVIAKGGKPAKVIYNAINMPQFKLRCNYTPNQEEPIRLVQVSRLVHEKKGQDILIHAIKRLVYDMGLNNCMLDIIGDGPSYYYLDGLIKELCLTGYVNLAGEKGRQWITANLCNYHLLIQPSRYEGFGLTVLEGFAAGLPVLASNIDGPAEIINGTTGGFLFENGNSIDCADKLAQILRLYKEDKIAGIMEGNYPLIENNYSMPVCAQNYLAEYKDAILTRKKAHTHITKQSIHAPA